MDQSKFGSSAASHIPKPSYRPYKRPLTRLNDSSLSNTNYTSGSYFFKDDDQNEKSKFNLTYTFDDAKKQINKSVHYIKSNLTEKWIEGIAWVIGIMLIVAVFFFLNQSGIKALNGTIKSVSQDKNLLEDKLEKLEKQFRKLSGRTLDPKSIDDQTSIDELQNEIEQSIIDKLDDRIEKLIDHELNSRLQSIKQEIEESLRVDLSESLANRIDLILDDKLKHSSNLVKLDENSINYSIKTAIDNLVLDKNSKLDYASELNNAYILDASPTFTDPNAFTILTIPFFSTSKPPSYLLKRDTHLLDTNPRPWKMNSNTGYVTIKLAKPIVPESFSYEHVLKSSILDENQFTCSPKVFRVIGYKDELKEEPIALGKFNFELSVDSYQTEFEFDKKLNTEISVMQFTVEDNYGNSNYTCMHRIRVF